MPLPRPALTPQEKQRAADRLEAAKDAQVAFGVIVPALGLPAYMFGVGIPFGLVAALLVGLLEREKRKNERAVNDPARPDFLSRTQSQPPRVDVKAALGESEFSEPATMAGEALRLQIAHLSALVRALERAQGAAEASDEVAYSMRLNEAQRFAGELTATAFEARKDLDRLAQELKSGARRSEVPEPYQPSLFHHEGGTKPKARADYEVQLTRAGITLPKERDDRPPTPEDVVSAAAALRKYGASIASFAAALDDEGFAFEPPRSGQ